MRQSVMVTSWSPEWGIVQPSMVQRVNVASEMCARAHVVSVNVQPVKVVSRTRRASLLVLLKSVLVMVWPSMYPPSSMYAPPCVMC